MTNTSKMLWPYPTKDSDPWFDGFESMTTAMDSSGYAAREDRNILISGGGNVSFTASSGLVAWAEGIVFLSTIAGFKLTLPAGSVTLADGACLYVNIVRSPTGNFSLAASVAGQVPNTDSAMLLAVRNGSAVYFRNGSEVGDGDSKSLFSGGGGGGLLPGSKIFEATKLATRESHGSDTPLVVGGDAFDPTAFDKPGFTKSMIFRAVAANGDIGLSNVVQLYNVSDSDLIATLTFTSTTASKMEAVLTEGTGAGQVDPSEKIYEVRIALGAPSGGPTETIELYGAEIIVSSTAT
jgi:hypothetical protein